MFSSDLPLFRVIVVLIGACFEVWIEGKRLKVFLSETYYTTTERHLPYGITQCYLPPDAGEHAPP